MEILQKAYTALPARKDRGVEDRSTVRKQRGGSGESIEAAVGIGQDGGGRPGRGWKRARIWEPRDRSKRKRKIANRADSTIARRAKKCREDIEEEGEEEMGDDDNEEEEMDEKMVDKDDGGEHGGIKAGRGAVGSGGLVEAGGSATTWDFEAMESVDVLLNMPNAASALLEAYKEQCKVVMELQMERDQMVLRMDRLKEEFNQERERVRNEGKQMKEMMLSLQRQVMQSMKEKEEDKDKSKEKDMEMEGGGKENDKMPSGHNVPTGSREEGRAYESFVHRKGQAPKKVHFQQQGDRDGEERSSNPAPGAPPEEHEDSEGKEGATYAEAAKDGKWRQNRARDVQMAGEFSKPS